MLMVNWPKMTKFVSSKTRPSRVSPSPEYTTEKMYKCLTLIYQFQKMHLKMAKNSHTDNTAKKIVGKGHFIPWRELII
jgi:hypothetical protein